MDTDAYRRIPKTDLLLETPAVAAAGAGLPRALVRDAVREELQRLRTELANGAPFPEADALERRLAEAVRTAGEWNLRRVINATGVILHTNLGRAPLGEALAAHVAEAAAGYSTLEYSLSSGSRGSRHEIIEAQLCRLTGAEAAMVVNNNAAAVFLMLRCLAAGKKVAVSRGELVEIGGSFRIPEIIAASSASILEVGTTNRTHPADYERALDDAETAAILKVHTSNYKIVGFTQEVSPQELSELAAKHDLPFLYDLGAGFLLRPESLGLSDGVYIPDAVRLADVCCFSGDKLLGAGQAGILLGKKEYIDRMKRDQLARIVRTDKMTLAALEGVLRLYEDPETAKRRIPVLSMLSASGGSLRSRAEALCSRLSEVCPGAEFEAIPCEDQTGGGSLPDTALPGWAVSVKASALSPEKLEARLRGLPIPVIARILQGRLLLSVRTLLPEDEAALPELLSQLEELK